MRIVDVVASLAVRPTSVVAATPAAGGLTSAVAEQLDLEVRHELDDRALVLAVVDGEDVATALTGAVATVGPIGDHATLLLLCDLEAAAPEVDEVVAAVVDAGLVVRDVVPVSHPTWGVALHLAVGDGTRADELGTALLLERWVSTRDRERTDAMLREVERRGERIERLSEEVHELRERLTDVTAAHEKLEERGSDRDRALVVARDELVEVRGSTSYRLGHALVRIAKNPALLLRLPVRILRRVRS